MADLQGGDWGVTQPFGGMLSEGTASPFPNPSNPGQDPFRVIEAPEHIGPDAWQTSYYDPRSQTTVSGFRKLPSGTVDINTGRLTGDFHQGHRWQQV